ncbi:Fibronectin type III [Trinorchestia longiramus]|nr:Fibronectin type III [Trinorchestia longiramus]
MVLSLPHLVATDGTKLTVNYLPVSVLTLTGGEGGHHAQGGSAQLTCTATAHPPHYTLTFLKNGEPLPQGRLTSIQGGKMLTLPRLSRQDSGLYTCIASNDVGDGQSNAVALHVDFAPVCAADSPTEVVVQAGEEVPLVCEMKSSPQSNVSFTWWAEKREPSGQVVRKKVSHIDEGTASKGYYTISVPKNATTLSSMSKSFRRARSVNEIEQVLYRQGSQVTRNQVLAALEDHLETWCPSSQGSLMFRNNDRRDATNQKSTQSNEDHRRLTGNERDEFLKSKREFNFWRQHTYNDFISKLQLNDFTITSKFLESICQCLQFKYGVERNIAGVGNLLKYHFTKCFLNNSEKLPKKNSSIQPTEVRPNNFQLVTHGSRINLTRGTREIFPYFNDSQFTDGLEISQRPEKRKINKREAAAIGNVVPSIGNFQRTSAAVGRRTEDRVECWASNEVGSSEAPCVFIFKIVELPGALTGCTSSNVRTTSADISCKHIEDDNGLNVTYVIKVKKSSSREIVFDASSPEPEFSVTNLEPGVSYLFEVHARHSFGVGPISAFLVSTRSLLEQRISSEIETVRASGEWGLAKTMMVMCSCGDRVVDKDSSFSLADQTPRIASNFIVIIVGLAGATALAVLLITAMSLLACRWRQKSRRKSDRSRRSSDGPQRDAPETGGSSESLVDLRNNSDACPSNSNGQAAETVTVFTPTHITSANLQTWGESPLHPPQKCTAAQVATSDGGKGQNRKEGSATDLPDQDMYGERSPPPPPLPPRAPLPLPIQTHIFAPQSIWCYRQPGETMSAPNERPPENIEEVISSNMVNEGAAKTVTGNTSDGMVDVVPKTEFGGVNSGSVKQSTNSDAGSLLQALPNPNSYQYPIQIPIHAGLMQQQSFMQKQMSGNLVQDHASLDQSKAVLPNMAGQNFLIPNALPGGGIHNHQTNLLMNLHNQPTNINSVGQFPKVYDLQNQQPRQIVVNSIPQSEPRASSSSIFQVQSTLNSSMTLPSISNEFIQGSAPIRARSVFAQENRQAMIPQGISLPHQVPAVPLGYTGLNNVINSSNTKLQQPSVSVTGLPASVVVSNAQLNLGSTLVAKNQNLQPTVRYINPVYGMNSAATATGISNISANVPSNDLFTTPLPSNRIVQNQLFNCCATPSVINLGGSSVISTFSTKNFPFDVHTSSLTRMSHCSKQPNANVSLSRSKLNGSCVNISLESGGNLDSALNKSVPDLSVSEVNGSAGHDILPLEISDTESQKVEPQVYNFPKVSDLEENKSSKTAVPKLQPKSKIAQHKQQMIQRKHVHENQQNLHLQHQQQKEEEVRQIHELTSDPGLFQIHAKTKSQAAKVGSKCYMDSHSREILYSQSRKILYSQSREILYSQSREILCSQSREILYSQSREILYSQSREILYSQSRNILHSQSRNILHSQSRFSAVTAKLD